VRSRRGGVRLPARFHPSRDPALPARIPSGVSVTSISAAQAMLARATTVRLLLGRLGSCVPELVRARFLFARSSAPCTASMRLGNHRNRQPATGPDETPAPPIGETDSIDVGRQWPVAARHPHLHRPSRSSRPHQSALQGRPRSRTSCSWRESARHRGRELRPPRLVRHPIAWHDVAERRRQYPRMHLRARFSQRARAAAESVRRWLCPCNPLILHATIAV
jgi:hypothetical protein